MNRKGVEEYNGAKEDEEYDLFRFLNAIMYPHKKNFMSTVTEYIDYSENAELWREVTKMSSLEQVVHAGVRDDALKSVQKEVEAKIKTAEEKVKAAEEKVKAAEEKVKAAEEKSKAAEEKSKAAEEKSKAAREAAETAKEKGIQAVIRDNLEEQIPKERILLKLQRHFNLTEEKAALYYEKYS